MEDFKNLSITIVTHVYATGPSFRLEDYLKNKAKKLIFIGHPFSFANDKRSFVRVYEFGKLVVDKKFIDWSGPELFFYLKDLFLTFYYFIKYSKKNDYFIGVNNFNAFTGYLLSFFSQTGKIIFYTIDYIPQRFSNNLINSFYHWIDRMAISKSYKVWNLSPMMAAQREKLGISKKFLDKQIVVPIGTNIRSKPLVFSAVDKNKIIFMGHLREGQGVEMLINSMQEIIKKVPQAHLLIIGGGRLENSLKSLVKKLGLSKHIRLTGFVESFFEVENLMSDAAVAVAPYVDSSKSFTRYTDPGKPKDYIASGIPVVITKVPQVAFEIEDKGCGIAVNYSRKAITQALIKLLSDRKMMQAFRKNAFKMAKEYEWNKVFDKAFRQTL